MGIIWSIIVLAFAFMAVAGYLGLATLVVVWRIQSKADHRATERKRGRYGGRGRG